MKKLYLGLMAMLVVATTALASGYDIKGIGGQLNSMGGDTSFLDSSTFIHSWTSTVGDTINIRTMGHNNGVVPVPFRIYGEYIITGKEYDEGTLTIWANGPLNSWQWNYGTHEGHEWVTIRINTNTHMARIDGAGALAFGITNLPVDIDY